ncbi:MAG: LPP20 family lipoprotein [Desulfovibrionaceae bacterium]
MHQGVLKGHVRMVCALTLALLVCLAVPALAEESAGLVEQFDNGTIDWQTGQIVAVGIGAPPPSALSSAQSRPMAIRAATVVARRNLLEILKGMHIDSATTVENYMVTDDTVVSQVRGHLQNSRILDTAYMSDGTIEVTVSATLRGSFADAVMPKTMPFKSLAATPSLQAPPTGVPAATPPPAPSFTGVVIDARGLGLRPALSPRIVDEQGGAVYGAAQVSREYAVQQGMAGYAKDMDAAKGNPRVAGNPLLLKAMAAAGQAKTDLVLGMAAAASLRHAAEKNNFLEKCRVMIVVD